MNGHLPYLPQKIITNILKRLPVTSLIQFQRVCKHWKNLFKTPSFIQEHLSHSSHHSPFLLFECFGGRGPNPLCLYLLDREMQVLEVQNTPLGNSLIVGSSNGLLCLELSGTSNSLLLYNPATREVRRVPEGLNLLKDEDVYVGFGFSPIVNDYKIVRVSVSIIDYMVREVEVYSLRTDSWKKVEVGNLKAISLKPRCFSSTNGAIFWFGLKIGVDEEGETIRPTIVSFDIATEVFTLIPMHDVHINYRRISFTVYENKLAVLYSTVIGNSKSSLIELWLMEEGNSESGKIWNWTKKYTSSPQPFLLYPAAIWENQIVCKDDADETKIVLINLTTNEFKMFAPSICRHVYFIFNHVESLVPISNIYIEEEP